MRARVCASSLGLCLHLRLRRVVSLWLCPRYPSLPLSFSGWLSLSFSLLSLSLIFSIVSLPHPLSFPLCFCLSLPPVLSFLSLPSAPSLEASPLPINILSCNWLCCRDLQVSTWGNPLGNGTLHCVFTTAERRLIASMQSLWGGVAATGQPKDTTPAAVEWPAYTNGTGGTTLVLGTPSSGAVRMEKADDCVMWDEAAAAVDVMK